MRIQWMGKFLLLSLISVNVLANAKLCKPVAVKVQAKNIILPGVDQPHTIQIYFFKNTSTQSIWLDHPTDRPAAGAGWSSYLRAGNASALQVNRKNFAISCALIKPGKVEYVNCAKELTVCTPTAELTLKSTRKGTYWVAEDKAWDDLLKLLIKHSPQVNSHK